MLDIQLLRNNIDAVSDRLATRGYALDVASFQKLEAERKTLQTRTQELQASRNSLSKQIGMLKGKGQDASAVMAEVAALKDELDANEVRLGELLKEFDAFVATIPNMPQESVPVGRSEADNVEVHRWGTPRTFDFAVKDHVDLGEALGQLDFATAAKIAGARFSLMKGPLARLHRIGVAAHQTVSIGHARLGGEIVHLVIHQHARALGHQTRAIGEVDRVSI